MNYATGAVRISVNLMVAIIMFLMFLMIVKLIVVGRKDRYVQP